MKFFLDSRMQFYEYKSKHIIHENCISRLIKNISKKHGLGVLYEIQHKYHLKQRIAQINILNCGSGPYKNYFVGQIHLCCHGVYKHANDMLLFGTLVHESLKPSTKSAAFQKLHFLQNTFENRTNSFSCKHVPVVVSLFDNQIIGLIAKVFNYAMKTCFSINKVAVLPK